MRLQGDLRRYLKDGHYSEVISIQETINLKLKAFEINKRNLSILIVNDISTNLLQNIVKYLSLTFDVYCDAVRKGNVLSFLRQRLYELKNPGGVERAYTLINEAQLEQCGTASVATMQTDLLVTHRQGNQRVVRQNIKRLEMKSYNEGIMKFWVWN